MIATGAILLPVRSVAVESQGRVYKYTKNCSEGFKLLSRLFEDIVLGKATHDFGWTVHSVYDNRFDAMSRDTQIHKKGGKTATSSCRSYGGHAEDFYFALLPARRYCN